ncbi:MAG: hypothetical protein Q4D79_11510 [Propionibacteriaceae bacterium]|nr:hypothetical protein [Propionibacteriaceae bacterium]
MTDSGKQRPRRAFAADDAQPDGVDDTRSQAAGRARRGAAGDLDSPFARPGSGSRDTAIPAPVLPDPEHGSPTTPAAKNRWDGLNDKTTPHGHDSGRQAGSSITAPRASVFQPTQPSGWPEPKPSLPAQESAFKPVGRKPAGPAANSPQNPPPASPTTPSTRPSRPSDKPAKPTRAARAAGPANELLGDSWMAHHRRALTMWVAGAVAAALLIAGGFYLFSRLAKPGTPAATANPSGSESTAAPLTLTEESLVSIDDASAVAADAAWNLVDTTLEPGKGKHRAACLGTHNGDINPVAGMQRVLGTTQSDQLALMHQVDVYANDEAARQIYQGSLATLAACADPAAQILSSTAITGLGDEVTQVTVTFQSDTPQFHSLFLVRSGRAVHVLDVTRLEAPVSAEAAAASLTRSLTSLCEAVGGTCPATPGYLATPPPASVPVSWLIPSDLPRITPTQGQWNAVEPTAVGAKGMGCEGIALDSEPGPTERLQRTLVLSDQNAPAQMGVDEVLFTFPDEATAATFGETLATNIASCAKRVNTAEVTELDATSGIGMSDLPVAARSFNIAQQISNDSSTYYQIGVIVTGNRVVYLRANVWAEFRFAPEQFGAIAVRAGQRATQG